MLCCINTNLSMCCVYVVICTWSTTDNHPKHTHTVDAVRIRAHRPHLNIYPSTIIAEPSSAASSAAANEHVCVHHGGFLFSSCRATICSAFTYNMAMYSVRVHIDTPNNAYPHTISRDRRDDNDDGSQQPAKQSNHANDGNHGTHKHNMTTMTTTTTMTMWLKLAR